MSRWTCERCGREGGRVPLDVTRCGYCKTTLCEDCMKPVEHADGRCRPLTGQCGHDRFALASTAATGRDA